MNRAKKATIKLSFFVFLLTMTASIGLSYIYATTSLSENDKVLAKNYIYLNKIPDSAVSQESKNEIITSIDKMIDTENGNLRSFLVRLNIAILAAALTLSSILAKRILQPVYAALEIRKRFIADASHELRTPLTAMKTDIEVNLIDPKLTLDSAKEVLKNNLAEIDKLSLLSNGLLSLAKYQEDQNVEMEVVYLKDKILNAYERVEAIAKKKAIKFTFRVKNVAVFGNEESLVKIFIILFDNAIKYSPRGSRVQIKNELIGQNVIIRIRDWGLGIKESDLANIFDPFFRSETSRARKTVGGYGIGLSIAKNIVDAHRGTIEAESRIGKGTTFIIKLPVYIQKNKRTR